MPRKLTQHSHTCSRGCSKRVRWRMFWWSGMLRCTLPCCLLRLASTASPRWAIWLFRYRHARSTNTMLRACMHVMPLFACATQQTATVQGNTHLHARCQLCIYCLVFCSTLTQRCKKLCIIPRQVQSSKLPKHIGHVTCKHWFEQRMARLLTVLQSRAT